MEQEDRSFQFSHGEANLSPDDLVRIQEAKKQFEQLATTQEIAKNETPDYKHSLGEGQVET